MGVHFITPHPQQHTISSKFEENFHAFLTPFAIFLQLVVNITVTTILIFYILVYNTYLSATTTTNIRREMYSDCRVAASLETYRLCVYFSQILLLLFRFASPYSWCHGWPSLATPDLTWLEFARHT